MINKITQQLSIVLAAILAASSLISCSSTAPIQRDYFVLSPSPAAKGMTISGTPKASISRVTLPNYLNQQNMVTQINNNQVAVLTQQLWADKLTQAIPSILAGEIAVIIQQPVETHPLPPGIHIPTRIEINIRQFIASNRTLTLQADYRIVNSPNLSSYRFAANIPLSNSNTPSLVNAYNMGLYKLASDIAKHL